MGSGGGLGDAFKQATGVNVEDAILPMWSPQVKVAQDVANGTKLPGVEAANPAMQSPTTADMANSQYGQLTNAQRQQQVMLDAASQQNGMANQNQAFQMAVQQAQGAGPNPAMAQLAQATQANTANQAALMAGQRGAGANSGLLARQAAMQGGANQQAMAGQAATLGAQQQLAGQQQMANIAGQQVSNQNQAMAGLNQAAQAGYGQVSGNLANQNNNALGLAGQQNAANMANQQRDMALMGGLIKGGSAALGGFANGGIIPPGPRSQLHGALNFKSGGSVPGQAQVAGDSPKNDTVNAKLSPGEVVIPRSVMQSKDPAAAAAKFVAAVLAKKGQK
jgi:hypothetical protein